MWFFLVGINSSEDSLLRKLRGGGGRGAPTPDTAETPEAGAQPRTRGGKVLAGIAFGADPTARLKPRRAVGTPGPGGVTSAGSETSPLSPLPSTLKTHFKLHKIAGDAGPAANTREWTGRSRGCP